MEYSLLILWLTSASLFQLHQSIFSSLKIHLIFVLLVSKTELSFFQLMNKISYTVITILKLELKSTVTISMELDRDLWNHSERKMGNGLFSTEIEDNALIEDRDCKHTATIPSTCWEKQAQQDYSILTISEVQMLWMSSSQQLEENIL